MWIFTQDGYVSVVDYDHPDGLLTVRSRDRQSLDLLVELTGADVEFTPYRDYQYRILASREQLNDFMRLAIETLDYPNFKNRLAVSRGKTFSYAAAKVWDAMNDVADDEALGKGAYAS